MYLKVVLVFIISAFFATSRCMADDTQKLANASSTEILFITSHTESDEWVKRLFDTFKESLAKKGISNVYITLAEFGVRRTKDCKPLSGSLEEISDYLKVYNPDLVIVSESPAIDFLEPIYDKELNDTPIIFCNYPIARKFDTQKYKHATAVKYEIEFLKNVELGMKLLPRTREIAIITDATSQGMDIDRLAREKLKDFKGAKINYFNGNQYSTKELLDALKALPKDSFIIFTAWSSIKQEIYISSRNIMDKIEVLTNLPILSVKGLGIDYALGGIMANDIQNAKDLAEMSSQILNGAKASQIKPRGPNLIVRFNAKKLSEYDISARDLPSDTIIYNQESALIDISDPITQTIAFSIIMAILLIGILEIADKRKIKQARDQASNLGKMLQTTFDICPFGICIKDPAQDFKFVMCNEFFAQMLKLSPSQILGKDDFELNIEGFSPADCLAQDKKALRENTHLSLIQKINTHDGERVLEITRFPLNFEDGHHLSVGIFNDITEKNRQIKSYQNALEAAKAAEKAKSYFLASMSHEIRTPLNAIIGFSDLLADDTLDSATKKKFYNNISFSGKSLLALINDILDLSKLESGSFDIVKSPTDITKLCNDLVSVFRHDREIKNLNVEVKIDDMPILNLDYRRVRQVLFNLMGNAVKFTNKGTLYLTAKFDKKSPDIGNLTLVVQDTGIGISDEDKERIFKPFVQGTRMRGTFAQNNGTGLGLAICRDMIERMGGKITLESQLNKGSKFTVVINNVECAQPKTRRPAGDRQNIIENAPVCAGKRVLLVDDVKMNLMVLQAMLKKLNIDIVSCQDPLDAIKACRENDFDAVITDIWMPRLNGADLAREIRKIKKHVNIFAVTADIENERDFDVSVFDDILLKPLTMTKLDGIIRKCCDTANTKP